MGHFHKIWIEQCEAAEGIKERYGVNKAMGYLIGEKLMGFVQAADRDNEFANDSMLKALQLEMEFFRGVI